MRKTSLIIAILIAGISFAQDSVSVLFIGNSYVYVNDLPTMFNNLTTSLGDEVTVDSKTNGGYTFSNHLNDPLTHTKIKSKPWDYVIIQGQSQEPSFPTSQVNTQSLPAANALADSVYENKYCSQVMYFMTWGRQNGDPQWDSINTFDKMNLRLRDAYVRISDSAQACVAPVGIAWKYVRDNHPTINLYTSDGSHPSVEGTYLAACTFYASVFRKDPSGTAYTAGLDPIVAGILQNAAALAVLDSLSTWHLRATEEITIADFQYSVNGTTVTFSNDSWRAQGYLWDFGDGATDIAENPTHDFVSNGTYSIQLIATSECGDDTLVKTITLGTAGEVEIAASDLLIKTVQAAQYEITNSLFSEEVNYSLFTLTGQELNGKVTQSVEKSMVAIDLQGCENGIYFLQISSGQISWQVKLMVIN